MPFTRGPERSRTSASVLREARAPGRGRLHGDSAARTKREQLSRSFAAGWDFATLLDARRARLPGIRRVRFTTSHPRDFVKPIIDAIDENPVLCNHVHLPVQSGSTRSAGRDAAALHPRRIHAPHRMDEGRARNIAITTDIIVGFPGETGTDFEETLDAARRSAIRFAVQLQVFAPSQHRRARTGGSHSRRREDAPHHDPAGEAARHSDPPQRRTDRRSRGGDGGRTSTRPPGSGSGAPRKTARSTSLRRKRRASLCSANIFPCASRAPARIRSWAKSLRLEESAGASRCGVMLKEGMMEVEMKIRGSDDGPGHQHADRRF